MRPPPVVTAPPSSRTSRRRPSCPSSPCAPWCSARCSGMIFGASSLYLVLKVGLTVSASIPVAVISITLFRLAHKLGHSRRHHPREQHRADRRLGGRIDRVRRRRDHAGDHDPRLRPGADARHAGGGAGRPARHPDDDPAAPRADRRAARRAQVPRGHGLRRGAQGRRLATSRAPRSGRRPTATRATAASAPSRATTAAARAPSSAASALGLLYKAAMSAGRLWKDTPEKVFGAAAQGRLGRRRDLAGAARRRLHHRPAHRVDDVRRRRARLPGADPADQVLRRRPSRARSRPAPSRSPRWARVRSAGLRALHRRGRGGGGRHHQPAALAADHLAGPARRPERRAQRARPAPLGLHDAAHRARPVAQVRGHRHRALAAARSRSRPRCT